MNIPTLKQAFSMLESANTQNPGAWLQHSLNVGRAAKTIAENCDMNSNLAYIMGLLHDIGRYEGIKHLHHVISGYSLMMEKEYAPIAKICLTHSFPIKNIDIFSGLMDCSQAEMKFIQS